MDTGELEKEGLALEVALLRWFDSQGADFALGVIAMARIIASCIANGMPPDEQGAMVDRVKALIDTTVARVNAQRDSKKGR